MTPPPITYADVTCPDWCRTPRTVRHSICTGEWAGPGDKECGVQVRPELWPDEGAAISVSARDLGNSTPHLDPIVHVTLSPQEAVELHAALGAALAEVGWPA
jgi:hypothetical protein